MKCVADALWFCRTRVKKVFHVRQTCSQINQLLSDHGRGRNVFRSLVAGKGHLDHLC
jgi:hypothetical protein